MGAERDRPDTVLIAGPTASGKSALALRLALRFGGCVINADSIQVYRDLRILSARPDAADERLVPHRLFGHVDGATAFSVAAWLEGARQALAEARNTGTLPIFAGGTGLYFKALTQGLSEIPPIPDAVRISVRAWATGMDPRDLHTALAARDPETAARLRPTDPQRITRALEVFEATGRSLTHFQKRRQPPLLDVGRCRAIALSLTREALRERLARRLDAMLGQGALSEVARLRERRLSADLPVMRAVGVPQLAAYLDGELSLQEALAAVVLASSRFAKRQETFLRHQLPGFAPVAVDELDAWAAGMPDRSDQLA